MDLSNYTMEQLLLTAIRSEIDARKVYLQLAEKVDNGFLSDKLKFIAEEEKKHRDYLESIYKMEMQKEPTDIPAKSPKPLPEVTVTDKTVFASQIIEQAMESELASADFYDSMADLFNDEERNTTMHYLAKMEIGHYKLLEIEKEVLENQEDYEFEWEMMHAGP